MKQRKNCSLEWFKMFGVLGVKVKYEEDIFMVGLNHNFEKFSKDVEVVVGTNAFSLFFVDNQGDKISVRDDVSILYCLEQWDMLSSIFFLAKKTKIYFVRKYIHQQSSRTALFK
uniref:Transmembrane domain containing protein n=1 Tax=Marseillevirus sp. TaxID=2809551 RepID=A0AA96EK25_9VIRU|nr:transmembrane domain containing protein [Marseillevirus sp.]